ncbi:hypothetical protein [Amycolatopsis thermoflava]|uniref:hypothetical protein n=1 Tax=Amycolatopsis thermoflava TaxID=84480 RepID=UPI003F4A0EA6
MSPNVQFWLILQATIAAMAVVFAAIRRWRRWRRWRTTRRPVADLLAHAEQSPAWPLVDRDRRPTNPADRSTLPLPPVLPPSFPLTHPTRAATRRPYLRRK